MRFILALILSICFSTSYAQIYNPVKWETEYKQVNETEFDLIFKAKIEDGWTIYSQYLEGDDGPIPTSFNYDDEGKHFSLVGKNKESDNKKSAHDKVFDMTLIKFFKYANFTQRVKVTDFSKPVVGYLEFMTCDETKCLPPDQIDFEFRLENKMGGSSSSSGGKSPEPEPEPQPEPQPIPKKQPTPNNDLSLSSSNNAGAGGNNQNQSNTTITKPAPTPKAKQKATAPIAQASTPKVNIAPMADEADQGGDGGSGFVTTADWTTSTKKINDSEIELELKAKIIDGWYLYSQFQDSEDGPFPTEFNYDAGDHYEIMGKAVESGNLKKAYDKVFEMDVQKFSKEAIFSQKIKIKDSSKPITGYFAYQTCDDRACIMNESDFYIDAKTLQVFIGDTASEKIGALDASNASEGNNGGATMNKDTIDQTRESILVSYKEPIGNCGGETESGSGLFWTFLLGFGGGLLALLTPCVFPMIPLTVSFFTKGSKTRAEGIRNGLIYGASIIVIYVALGLLITLVFGPEALNRLSTHWLPNLLFFIIFIVFAISFFGYFEITLPSSWTTKTDSFADQGGLLGTFFMAATLALVSFSCTGPIIGTALVESASNPMGPFIVMLGFSSALALPFGLFAAFPAWLNTLPQSGGWMTSVKVMLGFLELALAFKFLSVADYTFHWGILKYELFLAIWVIIGIAMTLYLLGYIRFPHDSPLKKLSMPRMAITALTVITTIYLATGFMYNDETKSYRSPSLLSGLAPPSVYNFFLPEPEVNADLKKQYPSFTKCANNIDCFKDYYEGLDYAKKNDMPVLLDFTGYGCVNCRKTEDNIWVMDDVRNNISTNFVLISLYVDDPSKLDKIIYSKAQKKKLRNVGNKWADFQIANFAQNSQPLYVLMSPDEKVLARPVGYMDGWSNWEEYDQYLNCGLQTFKGLQDKSIGMKN